MKMLQNKLLHRMLTRMRKAGEKRRHGLCEEPLQFIFQRGGRHGEKEEARVVKEKAKQRKRKRNGGQRTAKNCEKREQQV